jgi:hypothetical protein
MAPIGQTDKKISGNKNPINSPLWAITTYFNPIRYKRRLQNYRLFRQRLTVPLVTVELGYNGKFELEPDDADILLQVQGTSVLWQKERLLNLAIAKVPKHIKYISWLDCDIVFGQTDWAKQIVDKLESVPIIQTHSQIYRLERDVLPEDTHKHPNRPTRFSSVYLVAKNLARVNRTPDSTEITLNQGAVGFGWAARREIMDQHGFYDAMIIGGGDLVMACGAYGRFQEAIEETCLDHRRAAHYLAWARPFYDHVQGSVGYVDGAIYHLWHGEIIDRQYRERHAKLANLGFDPFTDLVITNEGSWALAENRENLEANLKAYFVSRKEDG